MAISVHAAGPTVAVIDDDEPVRSSIEFLLQSTGYNAIGFNSADAFNSARLDNHPNCLILDVRLPGLSGLGLQALLGKTGDQIPIIFITGHGDIPMASQAIKAGAINFLTKPFREQDLLDSVAEAIQQDRTRSERDAAKCKLHSLLDTLTDRERAVAAGVAEGLMNKQIAAKMGVSEITIKVHRRNAIIKLGARSVADLVRLMEGLDKPFSSLGAKE
jgi:FixJ family two-component response regulator